MGETKGPGLRLLLSLTTKTAAMPFLLFYRAGSRFSGKGRVFAGVSQAISLFPGVTGQLLRRGFYSMTLKESSSSFTIDFLTCFPSPNVVLGQHVYIGSRCIIAPCVIQDDVIIGSGVHVVSKEAHHFGSVTQPIRLQGGDWTEINIGRDSWIGDNATVMANIGSRCVVGAGSVVTAPVADNSVVVGNPARVIRKRQ